MTPKSRTPSPRRPPYGAVRDPGTLGALARAHRHRTGLSLEEVADATTLGLRFLSEFERGKENASLGRCLRALNALGLEVLVVPREEAERWRRARGERAEGREGRGTA